MNCDDPRVLAGQRAQLGLVVRVGQEAHVEEQVGVARRAVLEAEALEGDGQPARGAGRQHLVGELAPQHRRGQAGGVDDHVGAGPQRREHLALAGDAVGTLPVGASGCRRRVSL